MAMKPHLLLLLLLIASVLCDPFSVDHPATAEAAANPLLRFLNGWKILSKAKYLQFKKEIETASKDKTSQHEMQVCRQLVYYYLAQKKNAQEPMATMLKGLEIYINRMKLPQPFVKFCLKTVEEFEKKHPNAG